MCSAWESVIRIMRFCVVTGPGIVLIASIIPTQVERETEATRILRSDWPFEVSTYSRIMIGLDFHHM